MVLKGGARSDTGFVQVAHQASDLIVTDAVAEDEIVHAPTDIDGIDLDVAVMGERGSDIGNRNIQSGCTTGEATGCKCGNSQHRIPSPPV